MYTIAFKMLLRDRARYLMLVITLAFVSLLLSQQAAIFSGIMRLTASLIENTHVPVWVMDPQLEQVNDIKPLREAELAKVRSVAGVAHASPLYVRIQQARLANGGVKWVQLVGVDPSTLMGAPRHILSGSVESIRFSYGVIIDEWGAELLGQPQKPLKVGDHIEVNEKELEVMGICRASRSFSGHPFIYTSFNRALQIGNPSRRNLAFILVEPEPGVDPTLLAGKISEETGLKGVTETDLFWATAKWFFKNTGIPASFGTVIILGVIVGIVVSGQTFYSFVLDNIGHFAALKAMGASQALLRNMLLLQSLSVGFIGFGIGFGLISILGLTTLNGGKLPFYMFYLIPLCVVVLILAICMVAALIGIRRIGKLQPSEVFRG